MKHVFLLCLGLLLGSTAIADEQLVDPDTLHQWVSEGRILPLARILEFADIDADSRILDIEVEWEHGQLVYEIKVLHINGKRRKYYYDAATGAPVDFPHHRRHCDHPCQHPHRKEGHEAADRRR